MAAVSVSADGQDQEEAGEVRSQGAKEGDEGPRLASHCGNKSVDHL